MDEKASVTIRETKVVDPFCPKTWLPSASHMAVYNQCSAVVFLLLLPLTQAQNNPDCSVGNDKPTINENNPPGTVVTNITMGPDITVTIDTSSDSTLFGINGTELILIRPLDYEKDDNALLVTLNCLRGGAVVNSVNVIVFVGNLNDNSPVFSKTNITEKVPEDTKVNTTIIPSDRLTARDDDLDTIQYELIGITPEAMDYFNIQGVNNPAIYLHKALDYDKNKFMQLILYARDRAPDDQGNTATATINIDIQQADTKPPWFQPCTFINADKKVCISSGYSGRVNISEKTTEPLVLEPGPLYAIDPDYTLNEKIVYTIAGGNKDDVFLLNSDTGNLTMNKAANSTDTFILHIMATQANNAQRYSLITIEIKVINKSSHAPYFASPTYRGTVSAGLAALSLVMESGTPSKLLKIFAADDDFPEKYNPQITYKIENSSDFIVTRDGLVLTNTVLESAAIITVLAIATDEDSLQKANTIITVEVTPSRGTTPLPTSTTTAITSGAAGTGTIIPKPSGSSSASPPGVTSMTSTANSGPTESTSSGTMTTNNAGTSGPTRNSETGTSSAQLSLLLTTTKPATTKSTPTAVSSRHPAGPSESGITKSPIPGTNAAPGGAVQSTALPSSPSGGPSPHPTSTPVASRSQRPSGSVFSKILHNPSDGCVCYSESTLPQTQISALSTDLNNRSQGYSAQDMAALGATLAVLLVISLLLLGLIAYKHYGNATKCLPEKGSSKDPFKDFSNKGYQDDENPIWSKKDSDSLRSDTSENATPIMQQQSDGFPPVEPAVESSITTTSTAIQDGEEDKEGKDADSVKEVKSILTKDRKTANDGYKAVWFRDDIDLDTKDDVVVIEDQVIEEDDSDGDGDKNEEDEQDSQHGDPVVSFILESAQRQATDVNLKPDQGAGDAEEDILL